MEVTLTAEVAASLGLNAPGDEAYLEVSEVKEDGSVVVLTEDESEEAEDETETPEETALPPALANAMQAVKGVTPK